MNNPHHIDQQNLLKKLRNGDEMAFQELYTHYYSQLYLHAYNKLQDRELAKDIIHDLFADIWQKRDHIRIVESLNSYLYTAVRNRVLDHISKQQSKVNYLKSLTGFIDNHQINTDYRVREKMLEEQIELALHKLPPRVREVFELSRKQYLTHKEIATKLNLTEQSVRSYIKDALRTLRLKLGAFLWVLFTIGCKLF